MCATATSRTVFAFDFSAQQVLSADPSTLVPSTLAGDYYILVRGRSGNGLAAATLLAKALPFSVTDIAVDQGGDSRWVTVTITGARFKQDALVKLVRPGIAEVEPANRSVIDATKIIATFDLRNVPHGLYDVAVINPDGALATLPYRFLVEDALPIDVTIGLGGPRVVPAGQTGLYSISLQSLTNVDTPYVFFTFGAPQLLENPKVFGLPYTTFNSNVRGEPDGQRTDVPWASLDSEVNTTGLMLAPGYAFDVSAGGYVGLSFSVTSYPGLQGDLGPRLRGVPQRHLRRAARAEEGRRARRRGQRARRRPLEVVHRSEREARRVLPALHAVPLHRDRVGDADDARRVRRCTVGRGGAVAHRGARRSDGERRARQHRSRPRRLGERLPRRARGERNAAAGRPGAADPPRPEGRQPHGDACERHPRRRARQPNDRIDDADGVLRAAPQVVRRRAEHDRPAHRLRPSRIASVRRVRHPGPEDLVVQRLRPRAVPPDLFPVGRRLLAAHRRWYGRDGRSAVLLTRVEATR